jgi:ureidoglycolate lyase
MRSTGYRKLTKESFLRYGDFAAVFKPEGYKFGEPPVEFYRDLVQQYVGNQCVSYSACVVCQQDEWIIRRAEYHNHTSEAIICLDGDYLMHVAPACQEDKEPWDELEVFLIPKGTVVVTRPGVWHQAGFPYGCDKVHILCALPERTYANDCICKDIPTAMQVRVLDQAID